MRSSFLHWLSGFNYKYQFVQLFNIKQPVNLSINSCGCAVCESWFCLWPKCMLLLCALLNYLISIYVNKGEDMPLVEATLEIGNQGHVHSVAGACDIPKTECEPTLPSILSKLYINSLKQCMFVNRQLPEWFVAPMRANQKSLRLNWIQL